MYLFTTALGFASALACAFTKNYSQLLVARVFNGFFPSAMALGAVTVADLFFFHQRYESNKSNFGVSRRLAELYEEVELWAASPY